MLKHNACYDHMRVNLCDPIFFSAYFFMTLPFQFEKFMTLLNPPPRNPPLISIKSFTLIDNVTEFKIVKLKGTGARETRDRSVINNTCWYIICSHTPRTHQVKQNGGWF